MGASAACGPYSPCASEGAYSGSESSGVTGTLEPAGGAFARLFGAGLSLSISFLTDLSPLSIKLPGCSGGGGAGGGGSFVRSSYSGGPSSCHSLLKASASETTMSKAAASSALAGRIFSAASNSNLPCHEMKYLLCFSRISVRAGPLHLPGSGRCRPLLGCGSQK